MKIAQVLKKDEVPKARRGRKPQTRVIIEDFLESGAEAIEIDCEDKSPQSVYASFYHYSRTKGDPRHIKFPIKVRKNGDKVYILRADEVKE